MSLRYVFGGVGAGKTQFILDDITERSGISSRKLIFIVPEQFSLESEKRLLALSGKGCIIEPQVLGFKRLAYYVFSKTGKPRGKYLDEAGKAMLLRKLIINLGGKLMFYGGASGKQGFIDGLSRTISEFHQYGITSETLERYIEALDPKKDSYAKLNDLLLIVENYFNYISDNSIAFISSEEMLDELANRIYYSNLLDGCEVWIDSFNGFTPQEQKVIAALMTKASRVTIALLNDNDKISYPDIASRAYTDPFYEIKTTVNKLSLLAEAGSVKIEPALYLAGSVRYSNFPELDFLRQYYFRYSGKSYAYPPVNLHITRAANRYAEVSYIAEVIIELLRDENYRYSDIAVLTGSLADYGKIIRSVFRRHNIPVFIDSVVDVVSHPLTEMIRSAIDLCITSRSYESVFRFLRTGLAELERADVDYLENYALEYGIKGYKWDLDVMRKPGRYNRERVIHCKEIFLNAALPFISVIKPSGEYQVKEITARLYDMLTALDVQEKLIKWSDIMNSAGNNEMARRHLQIWDKVCEVFDKMDEILGDEIVNVKQYARILDSGLASMDMGMIPPSLEQILAGDIERSRLPEIKALFIIGTNDGVLPRIPANQGLLSDSDRLKFIIEGIEIAPDGRRKSFNENMLIYIALCKPPEKLYITYSAFENKPMRPSSVITKLKAMFPLLKETDAAETNRISAPGPMFTKTAEAIISRKKAASSDKIMYNWFTGNKSFGDRLKKITAGNAAEHNNTKLGSDSVYNLYGGLITTSVSRLEQYMQCPFAYFLRYNLNAGERRVYEARPVDIGSLFHNVLELFTKKIEHIGWRKLDIGLIDALVDECIEESIVRHDVFFSTSKYQYILKRISRIAKKSILALTRHIQSGDFEVLATELDFLHEYQEQGLAVTGRIDRVDIMEHGGRGYIKIIDYKSGGKRFSLKDVYMGEQLQLMVYLDIILKNGLGALSEQNKNTPPDYHPGGVFYFGIDDPIVNFDSKSDSAKQAYEKYRMSGLALADKDVIAGMDKNIITKSEIIPVVMANSRFSSRSSIATEDEFNELREAVNKSVSSIASRILGGNIAIAPRDRTVCDYCSYSSICGMLT